MAQKALLAHKNEIGTSLNTILQDIKACLELAEECEYYVRLVFNELLINALDYSKNEKIVLLYAIRDGLLRSCIYDRGDGFDPEEYLMNCPEITKENGRGVFLANQLCKSLRYNKKGDCAYFEIDLVNNL